jgi:membrane protein YdbS with pleckstrin-like domain
MRYADSLLTQGEVVVLRTRQHWLQLLKRARYALLLWLLGIVLIAIVFWFKLGEPLSTVFGLAVLIAFAAGLVLFLWAYWHWWAQDYMVTSRRLLKVTGVLNKQSADSSLEMINDVVLRQSMWGRLFNYGNLEIMTAAEEPGDVYHMLAGPVEFKKTMLTAKHNLETELRSGQPPTPPLRATGAGAPTSWPTPSAPAAEPASPVSQAAPPPAASAAAVPVAGAQPAPPPPAGDDSLGITQTLARLADLRDKGAITPEDYEQKKTELLGRL